VNAGQRRTYSRALDMAQAAVDERCATAERRAANAETLLRSVEEERERLAPFEARAAKLGQALHTAEAALDEECGEVLKLREAAGIKDAQLKQYEAELARFEAEERDVAKLRRRLQERADELVKTHATIRGLEVKVRDGATIVLASPASKREVELERALALAVEEIRLLRGKVAA
jgi:chromosome segregation ATPase